MKFTRFVRLLFVSLVVLLNIFPCLAQKKNTKKTAPPPAIAVIIDTIKIDHSQNKAPVAPFIDTLFFVYGNSGAVTPEQRAISIENNIIDLYEDPFFEPDSLKINIAGESFLITYMNHTIIGINDIQAEMENKSKSELTNEYLHIIVKAIEKEQERTGWKNIVRVIALSLLILAITALAIRYLNIGYRKFRQYVAQQDHWSIEKLKYILDHNKQIKIILFLLNILRFVCIAFILYFCLYAFLSLFPETKWLAETLIGYVLSPLSKAYHSVLGFIPDLFTIIVIIVLFRFFIKAMKIVTDRVSDGSIHITGFYPDWAEPTFNIVKGICYAFMIILIFPFLPGANTDAFKGVSVFLGILFSLGSTSIIANIVSGIVITYMRPFKMGDRIKMGEFTGNVIEKTPLVTRLKTPKNEIITIPNGTIMSAQTINYTHSAEEYGLILYATVAMGYDIPWRKVHELLIEAALNTPRVMKDPKPFVLQLALDDFYVQYQINVYTKDADFMAPIYSDLYTNVQDVFNREGIELLSPHFRAQRDGSEVNIPKEHVKKGLDRIAPFNMNVHITNDSKPE